MSRCLFAAVLVGLFTLQLPSFAAILLDDVMNKEDQQRTGVYKLSRTQKQALEEWLNAHCEIKTTQTTTKPPPLYLSLILEGGNKLQLSDGSVWEVSPQDVPRASVWLSPSPLKISASQDPTYPYLLSDPQTGISIRARPAPASP